MAIMHHSPDIDEPRAVARTDLLDRGDHRDGWSDQHHAARLEARSLRVKLAGLSHWSHYFGFCMRTRSLRCDLGRCARPFLPPTSGAPRRGRHKERHKGMEQASIARKNQEASREGLSLRLVPEKELPVSQC